MRRLGRDAKRLADDFSELAAGAKAVRGLGAAGPAFADELAAGFERARTALTERDEFLLDHRALLFEPGAVRKIDKARAKAQGFLDDADLQTRDDRRAQRLAQAEAALTAGLRGAEKTVRRSGLTVPPTRFRSGDLVGPSGGRVAIPRDAPSPLAGASIVFESGALADQTAIVVGPGVAVVGGRDVPAGPTFQVTPDGLPLSGRAYVVLPTTLPDGASSGDLAVFRRIGSQSSKLGGTLPFPNGTAQADTDRIGTFQCGIPAPPLGAPDGNYRVQMLAFNANVGTTSVTPAFDPSVAAALISQDYTFRRDGTGAAALGSSQVMSRVFTRTAPNHVDAHSSTIAGPFEFAWTTSAGNRFAFDFPTGVVTANAVGVASTDGSVLVIRGHGGTFDFLAVGVRAAPASDGAELADLDGRWVGVEFGVSFEDAGERPFRTQWTSRFTPFTVDDGVVAFESAGERRTTTVEVRAELSSPVHEVTTTAVPDGGGFTLTVLPDGALADGPAIRRGQFDPVKGLLALRTFDTTGNGGKRRTASLLVAVKKPFPAGSGDFVGAWNAVEFGADLAVATPDALTSSLTLSGSVGTFTADGAGDAVEAPASGVAADVTLRGNPPTSAMQWVLAGTSAATGASQRAFALDLDAFGHHTPATDRYWYGASGDGSVVLGATTTAGWGDTPRRGIVIALE